MPNKHKNRKKTKQSGNPPPTPPATPSLITNSEVHSQRSGPSLKQSIALPSPPPTPTGITVGAHVDELQLLLAASTIQVKARLTDTFPIAAFGVLDGSGYVIPVDYQRWPIPGYDLKDSIQAVAGGSWLIMGTVLSSILIGGNSLFTTKVPASLWLLAKLIHAMELNALDIGYNAADWTDVCRFAWAVFTRRHVRGNLEALDALVAQMIQIQCWRCGRITPAEWSLVADAASSNPDYESLNSHIPFIQHQRVYPREIQLETHPVDGPRYVTRNQDETQYMPDYNKDLNSLCRVIDMNNNMRSWPESFIPPARQTVLDHYAEYPILDHVQCLPPLRVNILAVDGERVWTSVKKVADLTEILVKDLVWPKRHIGRSLLCRVLTRSMVNGGISFRKSCQSPSCPTPFPAIVYTPSEIQTLWPIGTRLSIKEPYARLGAKGRTEILIAWPKDMVEVPRVAGIFDHPAVEPATNDLGAYRLAAATAFAQNKVKLAIRLASIGLNLASIPHIHKQTSTNSSHFAALLVGRAVAYWLNDQPGSAYSDCLKAEKEIMSKLSDPISPLWRRIKLIRLQSAYKPRTFTIAARHLVVCEHLGVHSTVLEPYREAIHLRIAETKGVYLAERGPVSLGSERALYQGPIKVIVDPVKGRKVVTSRAVKSGEELLVDNAIVALKQSGARGITSTVVRWGDTAQTSSPSRVSWTVHQVMDDPSIGQCIHSLAPNANIAVTNLGITDDERLEVFRNPCAIEVDLLERQMSRNAFGGLDGNFTIYGLGSMISHSCKSNIVKADFDGAESFKAMNDMAEGGEVFVQYVKHNRSFESRHGALLRNWYFDCDCSLCQADKTPGDRHEDRANMMVHEWPALEEEVKRHFGARSLEQVKPIITLLTAFAAKIDATYAQGRSAKLELSMIDFALGGLWLLFDMTQALSSYTSSFRHIEWELYSVEEMKKSKKAFRRFGFISGEHFLTHTTAMAAMAHLYLYNKQPQASSAMHQSLQDMTTLLSQVVMTESDIRVLANVKAGIPKEPPQNSDITDEQHPIVDPDYLIDGVNNMDSGQIIDDYLSQEQIEKMYKIKTMSNGEKVLIVDTRGTPLEGYEEEIDKQMVELMKGRQVRLAGPSSSRT